MSDNQDREHGVQNDFFNEARKARTRVSIFLTNGKRLAGRIKSFDRFAIVLDAGGGSEEMIFKHAIATISAAPQRPGAFHSGPPSGARAASSQNAAATRASQTAGAGAHEEHAEREPQPAPSRSE